MWRKLLVSAVMGIAALPSNAIAATVWSGTLLPGIDHDIYLPIGSGVMRFTTDKFAPDLRIDIFAEINWAYFTPWEDERWFFDPTTDIFTHTINVGSVSTGPFVPVAYPVPGGFVAQLASTHVKSGWGFLTGYRVEGGWISGTVTEATTYHVSFTPRGGGSGYPDAGIPEPATWMSLIVGFGLVGAAMRRKRWTVAA